MEFVTADRWFSCLLFAVSFLQFFLQQAIILQITKSRPDTKRILLSGALVMGIYSVITCFIPLYSIAAILLYLVLNALSYRFVHRKSILICAVLSVGQMVLSGSMEYFAQLVMSLAGGKIAEYTPSSQLMLRLLVAALCALLFVALRKFKLSLLPMGLGRENLTQLIIYLVFLYLFTLPRLFSAEPGQNAAIHGPDPYNTTLYLAFFIYNFMYMGSLAKRYNISQELRIQKLYTETLESNYVQLRGFKHDFSSMLGAISVLAEHESPGELRRYLESLVGKFVQINTTDLVNAELSKDSPAYPIVLSRLSRPEILGVQLRITLLCKLELHYCDPVDFCSILGNLLDNALEAAAESEEKLVELEISGALGRYVLVVSNSYNGTVDVQSLYREGVSGKTGHTGIGLCQTKTLVDKYRGRGYAMELETKVTDTRFTQTLKL